MATDNIKQDRQALQRAMESIIRDAKAQKKSATQQSVAQAISGPSHNWTLPDQVAELVFAMPARRRLADLVLPKNVKDCVLEFMSEFSEAHLLREHAIEPRHTLLLVGPPGNGKTSMAEAIAAELGLPLLSVRYDSLVDSFLGETANRLRKLIDYASIHECVLFFDEFDAVGKERNDIQETGEIKRVVSTLLVQLDRLPAHSVVICATNHPEMLDRAVWRRFELKLELPLPGAAELKTWFNKFKDSIGGSVGITANEFANCMAGESMSEIEAFTLDVRRKVILSKGALNPADAVHEVLDRWQSRLRRDTLGQHETKSSASKATKGTRKRSTPLGKAGQTPQTGDLLSGAE